MKILISADIEGCCGIVNWKETEYGDDYEIFRQIMTDEVNACIKGLKQAGVDEIVVRDAHDSSRNLLFTQFQEDVKIIRGWSNAPCDMMDGLDETFDGVIYIGYHSPSRSDGNPLSHTMNTTSHVHMKLNGKVLSEYHLNTYYAMNFNVPAIMISGDENICNIAKDENDLITAVPTKQGYQGAIISKQPKLVLKEIEQGAIDAINKLRENKKEDYRIFVPRNLELEIHYKSIPLANKASFYPGAIRLSSDKVIYKSNKMMDILTFIFFCD